jgi:hypothetical protein
MKPDNEHVTRFYTHLKKQFRIPLKKMHAYQVGKGNHDSDQSSTIFTPYRSRFLKSPTSKFRFTIRDYFSAVKPRKCRARRHRQIILLIVKIFLLLVV